MITENIIDILLTPALLLVTALGNIFETNLELPPSMFDILYDVTHGLGYFLPVQLLMTLAIFQLSCHAFRFTWYLILRAKSFVPTWGN